MNRTHLDCKHKLMMKSGASPDERGVLCTITNIVPRFSTAEWISKGYHTLVPGII